MADSDEHDDYMSDNLLANINDIKPGLFKKFIHFFRNTNQS